MASHNKNNNRNEQPTKYIPPNRHLLNSKLSVAIDFGTSNCAVAYSYVADEDNVIVINNWQDGVETHGKIPTAILFNENKQFVAFGNKAIEKYKELVYDGEHEENYFFRDFKMELYGKKVRGFDRLLKVKYILDFV